MCDGKLSYKFPLVTQFSVLGSIVWQLCFHGKLQNICIMSNSIYDLGISTVARHGADKVSCCSKRRREEYSHGVRYIVQD